jgi:hypothetical protein
VIILTMHDAPELLQAAFASGVRACIQKKRFAGPGCRCAPVRCRIACRRRRNCKRNVVARLAPSGNICSHWHWLIGRNSRLVWIRLLAPLPGCGFGVVADPGWLAIARTPRVPSSHASGVQEASPEGWQEIRLGSSHPYRRADWVMVADPGWLAIARTPPACSPARRAGRRLD